MGKPPFPIARATMTALRIAEHNAAVALRDLPGVGTGPMGLTPDFVKSSPEYRRLRAAYECAAKAARNYAGPYCKAYKRELASERAERRNITAMGTMPMLMGDDTCVQP